MPASDAATRDDANDYGRYWNAATRSFSLIYLRDGAVIALDCVNAVKDYVQGRALVTDGAQVPPAMLADASLPPKTMTSA